MKIRFKHAVAAVATTATIASCLTMTSCQGRKMSNMVPTGETVEVSVDTLGTEVPHIIQDSI